MLVAVNLNQCLQMQRRYHLLTSAQVLVRSWLSVFAVTTPLVSSRVDMAQITSQETSADLPIPWPDATAIWIASDRPVITPARSFCPISSSTSRDQVSGPSGNLVSSPCPQSKAYRTKPSGSCVKL